MKYSNIQDVLRDVQARYKTVDELSRKDIGAGCVYGKERNGIGCAIGCLLEEPADVLYELDNRSSGGTIHTIHRRRHKIYAKYFTDALLDELEQLQVLHDEAPSYEIFMQELERWITTGQSPARCR